MLQISVKPEGEWHDGPSIQDIRANFVFIVSLGLITKELPISRNIKSRIYNLGR